MLVRTLVEGFETRQEIVGVISHQHTDSTGTTWVRYVTEDGVGWMRAQDVAAWYTVVAPD